MGYKPRPDDLSDLKRNDLETADLEWMASITPELRDKSLFQAKLLAGALWEAPVLLIDQLFEDVARLCGLNELTRQEIFERFVLSGLPQGTWTNTMRGSPSNSWSFEPFDDSCIPAFVRWVAAAQPPPISRCFSNADNGFCQANHRRHLFGCN